MADLSFAAANWRETQMKTWMQRATIVVVSGVAIFLITLHAALAEDEKPRTNVIVIVGDDMGYSDLGIQGARDIPTPHLDALAESGVRFTNGYVSGPYCSPTRAGLLTGRYQQRFGHEFNPGPPAEATRELGLPLTEQTLASQFQKAGYRTALVGKWHLGHADKFHPLSRGFDEFFGFLGGAHPYLPGAGGQKQNPIMRGREALDEREYLTDAFAREAVAFIERHKQQPFFLYLAFNAVHTPLEATDKYRERFASIENPKRRAYAAMMSALDDAVGRVTKSLADSKLEERTLVVFFSDNGGPAVNASSNAPLRGHKATTWEGGVRVPFFMSWKGRVPAGKVYDQPVIQLDVFPTALAAAQISAPADVKLDGVDLLPFVTGANDQPPHDKLYWRFGAQRAIRAGDWKLVHANGVGQPMLVNLREDVSESTDRSAAQPEKVAELENAWKAWSQELIEPRWKGARAAAKAAVGGKKKGPGKAKGKAKAD